MQCSVQFNANVIFVPSSYFFLTYSMDWQPARQANEYIRKVHVASTRYFKLELYFHFVCSNSHVTPNLSMRKEDSLKKRSQYDCYKTNMD